MQLLPRRLNTRIILIVSCILLATGVTYGWMTAKNQAAGLLAAMRVNSSIMVANFADNCARYLLVQDYAELESFLLKSAELADVRRLQLCEPDGTLIWDVTHRINTPPRAKTGIARIAPPPGRSAVIATENDLLVVWQPVMAGNILGWLKADFSLSAIKEAQSRTWERTLLMTISWVACSALLVILVLRPIVRAIKRLTVFANQLDERKGAQIALTGQPLEIADLAASLNGASIKLLSSERQLLDEQEAIHIQAVELEQEVAERQMAQESLEEQTIQLEHEIEERRNAQAELEVLNENLTHSEERLKEAQRIAKLGSWELDLVQNKLIWSDEIFRIFEIDPVQFGASYEAFLNRIHPDDRARVDAAYTGSVRNRTPYAIDHRLLFAGDRIKHVREQCETFYDADGRALRSVGTVQDVSELKAIEAAVRELNAGLEKRVDERTIELRESRQALMNIVDDLNRKTGELETANAKLLELDRLKSMFIASMSHELRTPLNSIIGFSSIIRDEWLGPVNPEQKENLETIQRSGKHLLSLINDVIDVSKIEAGRIEIRLEEFDLHDLLTEAVQYVDKDIRDKKLELTLKIDHHPLCTDRRRLLQCVINLLSNAVKFTERGGITVSSAMVNATNNPLVSIAIGDSGIGISREDIPKLFVAFVRLDSHLKTTVPGTGLGLYLTRKLVVDVLKGDIACQSASGVGSTFTLTIPERIHPAAMDIRFGEQL